MIHPVTGVVITILELESLNQSILGLNRTIKIVSVLLIIILAATVVLSLTTNWWFAEKINRQRSESAPNSWQTFQNNQFDFTFKYPPDAIVDISDPAVSDEPKRIRVRLIGPESEPNTEMADGFVFYARTTTKNSGESLSEAALQIFNSLSEKEMVRKEREKSTTIGNRKAYTFTVRSELGGEVIHTIIEGADDTVFINSSIVSTPSGVERNYESMIGQMQRSLQKTETTF